jgi:hypothetical protein
MTGRHRKPWFGCGLAALAMALIVLVFVARRTPRRRGTGSHAVR